MNPQSKITSTTIGRAAALLVTALLVALGLAAIAIAGASKGQSGKPETRAEVERALVGTWRLTSFPITDQNGDVVGSLYGDDPVAKVTYTPQGDMWAFVGARDRTDPISSSGTRGRSRFARERTRSSTSRVVLGSRARGHETGPPLQPARRSARAQLSGGRHRDRQRALRSGSGRSRPDPRSSHTAGSGPIRPGAARAKRGRPRGLDPPSSSMRRTCSLVAGVQADETKA